MNKKLEKEFEYYIENQDKLVEKYEGKFLVIKNCKIIGIYDSELEAVNQTSKDHAVGTFLIQKCLPWTESYTQVFHSRVISK